MHLRHWLESHEPNPSSRFIRLWHVQPLLPVPHSFLLLHIERSSQCKQNPEHNQKKLGRFIWISKKTSKLSWLCLIVWCFLCDLELRNFQSVIICTYIFSIFFTTLIIVTLYNVKVSISPTFYDQLFCRKVFFEAFMCLQFGFVIFFRKKITAKAFRKMLVTLTIGRVQARRRTCWRWRILHLHLWIDLPTSRIHSLLLWNPHVLLDVCALLWPLLDVRVHASNNIAK